MAIKSQNTMAEGLQSMVQDLATMKTMPDADLKFLLDLETTILTYLRQGMDQAMGQLNDPTAPPPDIAGGGMGGGMGGPPGGGMPGPPLPSSPMGGRGMMTGTTSPGGPGGVPAVGEIQRLLSR